MPELPEVEIWAQKLRRWLVGRVVVRAKAVAGTPLRNVTPAAIARGLGGRRFDRIERRGKQLLLHLDGEQVLLVHLGMTGWWSRREDLAGNDRPKLLLELDDGAAIAFLDTRRFGRVRLLSRDAAERHPEIKKLGPDALELSRQPGGLALAIGRARTPIKLALMDQARLAGVGNIYASEALFDAKIDPARQAASLSAADLARLSRSLSKVLTKTIGRGDAELEYVSAGGKNRFKVYGHAGEPCPRCHTAIARTIQGGRATFHCPSCQRSARSDRRSSRRVGAAHPRRTGRPSRGP